jgi:hypothetical protein
MLPVGFSSEELDCLFTLALPVPPERRDAYLDAICSALERYPARGPGLVHRLGAALQRDFSRIAVAIGAPLKVDDAKPAPHAPTLFAAVEQRLIDAVRTNPRVSAGALAHFARVGVRAARKHLKALELRGAVVRDHDGAWRAR